MKKITFLILSIVLLAFNSHAMQPISEQEMDGVRGQSGVSITIDDYAFYNSFKQKTIRDLDGKGEAKGAELNINDLEFDVLRVNAIAPDKELGTERAHFNLSDSDAIDSFEPSPFVLDVTDEIPVLSPAANFAFQSLNAAIPISMPAEADVYNIAGFFFRLPTVSVYADEISIGGVNVQTIDRDAVNSGYSFGSLKVEGLNLAILGGMGDLHANSWYDQHGSSDDGTTDFKDGSGVFFTVDDVRLYSHIDKLRYEDTGGLYDRASGDQMGDGAAIEINDIQTNEVTLNALIAPDMSSIMDILVNVFGADFSGITEGELLALYSSDIGLRSPGNFKTEGATHELNLENMDNLKVVSLKFADPLRNADSFWDIFNLEDRFRDMLDLRGTWLGQPIWLDVTNDLPRAAAVHQLSDNESIAGLRMHTGTVETHINELSMQAMKFVDPSGDAVNSGASMMDMRLEGVTWAQLGGTMEVAPHGN